MLIQRIITAFVFGALIIVGIFYLPMFYFRLLALLLVGVAVWEFSGFFWKSFYIKRIGFITIFLLVAWGALLFSAQPTLIIGGFWWLAAPYFLWRYAQDGSNYFTHWFWQGLVGILIFVPCVIGLIELQEKFGASFLLALIAIVCATDIGAYFAGRYLGKHLIAPTISPKKTFEGLLGGLFLALIVAAILLWWLGRNFNLSLVRNISWLLLIIIICLWSVIGDLFESMLKRQVGIKDSGKLLPGHGGMYDRIDSLTAAVPIFVLGLLLI